MVSEGKHRTLLSRRVDRFRLLGSNAACFPRKSDHAMEAKTRTEHPESHEYFPLPWTTHFLACMLAGARRLRTLLSSTQASISRSRIAIGSPVLASSCRSMSSTMLTSVKTVAPYGAWKSPISAELLTEKNVSFGEIAVTSCSNSTSKVVFVENRPQESGRAALLKMVIDCKTLDIKGGDTKEEDLTRGKYNVRSGVHEYGGGAVATSGKDDLFFTDYKTFDVFQITGEGEARKLTPGE
jgi:hypothetical protein